ncbi:hypothetical protein LSAT2_015978 [Lamellibrachia satsuma]|nr:hypothetical protein LSAT2_015978 [Lamellibrachia satsuma]
MVLVLQACSLTDVDSATSNGVSKTPKLSKSSSAGNTPVNSHESSLSSIGSRLGLRNSEKKKEKADIKKMKKMLKNVGKNMRPSYLPDSALASPLLGNLPNGNIGSVELKALRPKGSLANMRYELPLKATPDATSMSKLQMPIKKSLAPGRMKSERESRKQHPDTPPPPLQPRATRRRSAIAISSDSNALPQQQLHKRSSSATNTAGAALPPHLPPRAARRSTSAAIPPSEVGDVAPSRPLKRRRISHNNSSASASSPQKSTVNSSITANSSSSSGVCGEERTEPMPALPCDTDTGLPYMFDSQEQATRLFECLIHPVKPVKFFNELWEKKPLLVKRHMPNYNDGWFSTAELDRVMREERLHFSENIDVVTYTDGKRETHNPGGRAFPSTVWDYYQNGCSVRLLNPHTYSVSVWKLLSILQEYFGCCVGANLYLTPPATQGFAPHWDDIEAFILQLEGKKHWRLYSPR